MDRNTFTGLFLIMVIIFGSFYLMSPSKEDIKKQQQADSLKKAAAIKTPIAAVKTDTAKKALVVDTTHVQGTFGEVAIPANQKLITLENKDLRLQLTTHGGRIYSAELK